MADPSEAMLDHSEVTCDGHFVLKRNKELKPKISFLTGSILNMSRKALINKGIKVKPGETFEYCQQKEDGSLYIFEAGLAPKHAELVKESIFVYMTCKGMRFVVGTLSSKHRRIQLNLFMNEDFQLTHSSKRRTILFNGYQFSPVPLSNISLKTNKKIWDVEIKPFKSKTIRPRVDEKKYHISKVFIMTNTNDTIEVYVQCLNKSEKIGTLSSVADSLSCDLDYDEEFTLSHTSETMNVIVSGYTVRDITPLKKLPGPPVDKFNLKLSTNDKFDLMLPAKRSADPEYMAYVKQRKGAVPAPNLTAVSVVPAPLVKVKLT